jgi:hypothetical protein
MASRNPQSVLLNRLEAVQQWRRNMEEEYDKTILSLQKSEADAKKRLLRLQQEIFELAEKQKSTKSDRDELDTESLGRSREAVLEGLHAAKELLSEREAAYRSMVEGRDSRVEKLIASPEVSRLVGEYQQFLSLQDTLSQLPEGYREAMLAHHSQVRNELRPIFNAMNEPLGKADVGEGALGIVSSIEVVDDVPEALAILLPVPFEIYTKWSEEDEGLKHKLVYRILAAVAGMLKKIGSPNAPVHYAEYDGCLAIQVWLGDSKIVGDVRNALVGEIEKLRRCASELRVVRLSLDIVWMDPEVIAPEEDEDELA